MKKYRELLDRVMVPDKLIDSNLNVEWISADKLLTSERVDLVAKLLYLKSIDTNLGKSYSEYLYKEHLACFSHGCFYEPGNPEKNNFEKFKKSFDETFTSIKNEGFNCVQSLIPVSKNSTNLIDGAHRVSCAIYLELDVPKVEVNSDKKVFDLEYFKNEGMKIQDVDFLCHKYINSSKNKSFHAICLWPRSSGFFDEIDLEIRNEFVVLAKKVISLDANGSHNFLSQIYSHDQWVGNYNNDYQGVSIKKNECFGSNLHPAIVYFVESEYGLEYITSFKNDLRDKFGFGKHLLHITDNKAECLQICELVLNENSLLSLNSAYPTSSKKFQHEFHVFLKEIDKKNISKDKICIVGGAVLAAYGIRDTDDIDFITSDLQSTLSARFDQKNYEFDGLDIDYDDVIFNPDNYFYYMGVKFCSLTIVSKLKGSRGESKDFDDIKMIKLFLNSEKTFKSVISMRVFEFKRLLRRLLITSRVFTGKILRKIGLFDFVKKLLIRMSI